MTGEIFPLNNIEMETPLRSLSKGERSEDAGLSGEDLEKAKADFEKLLEKLIGLPQSTDSPAEMPQLPFFDDIGKYKTFQELEVMAKRFSYTLGANTELTGTPGEVANILLNRFFYVTTRAGGSVMDEQSPDDSGGKVKASSESPGVIPGENVSTPSGKAVDLKEMPWPQKLVSKPTVPESEIVKDLSQLNGETKGSTLPSTALIQRGDILHGDIISKVEGVETHAKKVSGLEGEKTLKGRSLIGRNGQGESWFEPFSWDGKLFELQGKEKVTPVLINLNREQHILKKDLDASMLDLGQDKEQEGMKTDINPYASRSVENENSLQAVAKSSLSQGSLAENLISRIVRKAQILFNKGQAEMKLDLKPESLGNLRMHLLVEDESLVVKLRVDNLFVKNIIESHLSQLKQSLMDQGIKMGKFSVFVGENSTSHGGREEMPWLRKEKRLTEEEVVKDIPQQGEEMGLRVISESLGAHRVNYIA